MSAFKSDSEDADGEDLGLISPGLIRVLRNVLDEYPDDGQILKTVRAERQKFIRVLQEAGSELPDHGVDCITEMTIDTTDHLAPSRDSQKWLVVNYHPGQGEVSSELTELRSPTGLPVHVNGYFALSQNRRHLKWPTQDQLDNQAHLEAPVRWNCLMVKELVPRAYTRLLGSLFPGLESVFCDASVPAEIWQHLHRIALAGELSVRAISTSDDQIPDLITRSLKARSELEHPSLPFQDPWIQQLPDYVTHEEILGRLVHYPNCEGIVDVLGMLTAKTEIAREILLLMQSGNDFNNAQTLTFVNFLLDDKDLCEDQELLGIARQGEELLQIVLGEIKDSYDDEANKSTVELNRDLQLELIQNADDAGATEVRFLLDERENLNARSNLISEDMASLQGPAIWAYNDAVFTDKDFENITKLGAGTKKEDASKEAWILEPALRESECGQLAWSALNQFWNKEDEIVLQKVLEEIRDSHENQIPSQEIFDRDLQLEQHQNCTRLKTIAFHKEAAGKRMMILAWTFPLLSRLKLAAGDQALHVEEMKVVSKAVEGLFRCWDCKIQIRRILAAVEKALKAVLYSRDAGGYLLQSHDLNSLAQLVGDPNISQLARSPRGPRWQPHAYIS
nr:hypothetical protein BaRGS_010872 [Batillaria attramentaria]